MRPAFLAVAIALGICFACSAEVVDEAKVAKTEVADEAKTEAAKPEVADEAKEVAANTEEAKPDISKLDTDGDGKVSNEEIEAAVAADPTLEGALDDLTATIDAGKDLSKVKKAPDWHAKLMIIAGFLAVLFKLLLSSIKYIKGSTNWFAAKKAKRIVKYSTLGLGALAGLAGNLAFGLPIVDCVMLFMSGPVAVAMHEYTKDSKDG